MSYKYKDQLSTLADMYLNTGDHEPLLEIERVYTQAAKADEYEAKAKAFDAYHSIISNHIEQQYSHNKHDMVKRFVKIHDEYERGESE